MPELPDVEAARRYLARHGEGRRILRVVVPDAGIVRNAGPRAVAAMLRGRPIARPERIGKWLLCWTDGPGLLLHFGMTGELRSSTEEPARHRWDRLILGLDDGTEIRYRNMRRLGGVWLAPSRSAADTIVGHLGPDALEVEGDVLRERLRRRKGGVKAALLDQSFLAGVGNLLADEILWRARLHPRHRVEALDRAERERLVRAVRSVVRAWVDRYDDVPKLRSWLIGVRDEPEATCPRCGTPLERVTAGGRTSRFCPSCQPAT
ncbi:MAG TPA: DNA-formamidopyrimidine glycosylase family protein [Actinomycetota bacterium]|nr:DNA-formamidopyrimidine glycosylase family protein [Actinomycetota bacterium]